MDLSSSETTRTEHPKPKDSLAVLYFLWIGGVSVIGYGAIQNSFDYFDAKFPGQGVKFVFPLAIYMAQVAITLVITHASKHFSYNTRIVYPFLIVILVSFLIPLQANMFQNAAPGMCIIMGLLFALGFFQNMTYASIAGFTSQLPGKYAAYFLIGVAVFSLVMNGLREITLLMFPNSAVDDVEPIIAYAGLTSGLILIGLFLHVMFMRSDFYKALLPEISSHKLVELEESEIPSFAPTIESKPVDRNLKTMLEIFKESKFYIFLILLSLIQQNLAYPGVALAKPMPNMLATTKTVSIITTHSIFFIFGKKMGQYRQIYTKRTVVIAIIIRFAMVALFIVQAITTVIPILNTNWFGYLNVAAFAVTMGFCNVALFIMIPEQVSMEKKEIAGFVSVCGMYVGGIIGGFLALPLKNIGI